MRRTGNEIGNQLGCKHPDALACLPRLPASKLLKQTLSFSSPAFGTNLLPREPGEALRSGRFHRIPTLSGNNRDDARSYVSAFSGGKIDAAGYRRLLRAMVGETRASKVQREYPLRARAAQIADPATAAVFSVVQSLATQCHDYPRAFSYADPLAARRLAYDRALGGLDQRPFHPFSPRGWSQAGFEATDTCLHWPADPTATAPLAPGAPLPDVPALVLSGDLDTNTPPSAGRQVARRFAHATRATIANAGHTPTDSSPCALALATHFVSTLTARPSACAARP